MHAHEPADAGIRARPGGESAVAALLRAWCAGFAVIMLWGYGLSLAGALASTAGWWIGAVVAAYVVFRVGWTGHCALGRLPAMISDECRERRVLALVLAGAGVMLFVSLIVAAVSAPSNWDSLTYHLARAGYYLQQGSLDDYGANFMSQEQHARGASIVLGALITLCGGSDAWVELPQIFGCLACLAAVYALARRLGAARHAALAGAGVFGALTIVVMEAPTPQNDVLLASFLGCGLVGTIDWSRDGRKRSLFLAASGFALALAVKASALTMVPSCAVLVAVLVLRADEARAVAVRRALGLAGATAVAIAVFAFPAGYVKNLQRYGNPLGGEQMFVQHTRIDPGEPGRLQMGALNVIRFTGDLLTLDGIPEGWGGAAGSRVKRSIGASLEAMGWDVEQPVAVTAPFSWERPRWADENLSFFGWLGPALLLPGCVGALFFWRRRPLLAAAGLAAFGFLAAQSIAGPYDPWRGRHFIYGAMLAVPAAAWMFESRVRVVRVWAWGAAAAGAVLVVPALLWRSPNPLLGYAHVRSVFALERLEQMAVHHPSFPALAEFERRVPADARVIVALPGNEYEYPLFGRGLSRTLLTRAQWGNDPELEHTAGFLLYDRRLGLSSRAGDIDLGYHWSLRDTSHPIRLADFARVTGLHAIEDRFAWMDAELVLEIAPGEPGFVNIEAGERFPPLAEANHLLLSIDGTEHRLPVIEGRCAVSVPVSSGVGHELRLRSPTGASSPRAHELSSDARELSYRVRTLQFSRSARFAVVPPR